MTPPQEARGAGARLLKLLQCVAEGATEFTLTSLAQRLRLPPSTVHRLLQVLLAARMIERAHAETYRPGRELLRLASLLVQKLDVPRLAQPLLRELWTRWQESCSVCLYRPADRSAVVTDTIPSPHPLQFIIDQSTPISLAWGSLGRSILAYLPDADIDAVLAQRLRSPLSGRAAPPSSVLRRELARIRRRGYALYADRARLDVAGVAAPIFGPSGQILGCLGVTMPASRFRSKDCRELATSVALGARRLSAALGHQPPGTRGRTGATLTGSGSGADGASVAPPRRRRRSGAPPKSA